jgi:hypothetical protein
MPLQVLTLRTVSHAECRAGIYADKIYADAETCADARAETICRSTVDIGKDSYAE